MDNQSMPWLPEMEMEERGHVMKHQQTRPNYYTDSVDLFSSDGFKSCTNLGTTTQCIHATTVNSDVGKQQDQKATNISPFVPSHASTPNTFTISFRNPTSPRGTNHSYGRSQNSYADAVTLEDELNLNEFLGCIDGTTTRNTRRNDRQLQEHVVAERKRREKLAERFVSLSTLLPGLKKMDKATVLEDARRYIIQLQTRVKELEETSTKGKDIVQEFGINPTGIPKFGGGHDDIASSSNDTNDQPSSSTFEPEIKARISGNKLLVRIYCMKSSALILKTLTEMERLNMCIVCCNVLPFDTAHVITIVAQMNDEMVISAKYLVQRLLSTLRDFR